MLPEVSNHGFRIPAAGDQLRTDVYRTWSRADARLRGGLGRSGSRIEFDGSVLRINGLQLDWRGVAGPVVTVHGGCRHLLCGVAEYYCGTGGGDRQPGQGCGRSVRGRLRGDGAAAGDRGQPFAVDDADRDKHPGAEHSRDRCHRNPLHGNVGPGRRRDVRLRRVCRQRLGADSVHRAAADDQPSGHRAAVSRSRSGRQLRRVGHRHADNPVHQFPADRFAESGQRPSAIADNGIDELVVGTLTACN